MSTQTPATAPTLMPTEATIAGATWAGGPTEDLGSNRREFTCPDGSRFVTDPAEDFTFDRAQSEHVMFTLMIAGFLGELVDGP